VDAENSLAALTRCFAIEAFGAILGLLVLAGRGEPAKDIEILVLGKQVQVLSRQVNRGPLDPAPSRVIGRHRRRADPFAAADAHGRCPVTPTALSRC
jgi:hypothetical protein